MQTNIFSEKVPLFLSGESVNPTKMLALSWKQPFASLMLHGKIETRVWPTHYRGWVLICASQQPYKGAQIFGITGEKQYERIMQLASQYPLLEYTGHAIAIAKLVACRPMKPADENACFVTYYPDLYCHVYDQVHAIRPFPWKGSQGWTEVSPEQQQRIIIL
jgi:hypothetical protein